MPLPGTIVVLTAFTDLTPWYRTECLKLARHLDRINIREHGRPVSAIRYA